jgi:hypothetical protein
MGAHRPRCLTIGSSDRGARIRRAKEWVDDLDKSVSLVVDATPRRSTSSLEFEISGCAKFKKAIARS